MSAEKDTKAKFMTDAQGNAVPVQYVKPYDRQRDRIARRVLARHLKARDFLARVKADTLADIEAIRRLRADGGEKAEGAAAKGNAQFSSFDGLVRVRLDAREFVDFDDRFKEAKALIFEYLEEITADSGSDIATIVRAAFDPSRRTGIISRAQVVGLRRLNISHPKWARAMALIGESEFVRGGKAYVYCESRSSRAADFAPVSLDFAAIDPADAPAGKGASHD